MRRPTLALLLGCLLLVAGVSALDGYDYYQTIEYAGCDQEVYQQDIIIHRSAGTAYNETAGGLETWHIYAGDHCQADYDDIRFTNSTGAELAYYLWPDYNSTIARFCVRLEGADAAGTLAIHYGNATAETTSDGRATYLLFEEYSNDLSQFNTGAKSGGKVEIDSGALKIYQNPSGAHWGGYASTKIKFTNGNGISIVFKHKKPSGYDVNLRQMQSIWAVTDSATSGRNPYYYLPATGEALIWKSPPGVSTFTESRIDISAEGTFRVNGGSWVSGIKDVWGGAHPWSRVGATYNLEFLNCDYGNYPCYFDDIRVSAYSATPPAALTFVVLQPFPGCSNDPTDPDADGLYEDINGNGRWDFQDLVLFFQHLTWCNANQPITLFDWNSNFRCDFDDVHKLWLDGGMI